MFLSCATLSAQLTLSTVRGTAADPTGAVMPVRRLPSSISNQRETNVTTNSNGDYEIADLYRAATVSPPHNPDSKTFIADDVVVEGQQVRRVNIVFEIGAVEQR